ncbi:MAG: hypothetical protein Q9208_004443 [Pyrenodesmia sp. 3 TL-2023]
MSGQGPSSQQSSSAEDLAPQQGESKTGTDPSTGPTSSSSPPPQNAAETVSPQLSSSDESTRLQDSPSGRVVSSSRTSLSALGQTPPPTVPKLHIDAHEWGRRIHIRSLGISFRPSALSADPATPQLTPLRIPPAFVRVEEGEGEVDSKLKRTLGWVEDFQEELRVEAAENAKQQAQEFSTKDATAEDVNSSSDMAGSEAEDDTTWKAAFESREQVHEIELGGLLDRIAELEKEAKDAKVRKETFAKAAKRNVDKVKKERDVVKDELKQQKERTKAAEQGSIGNLQRQLAHAQHRYSALETENSVVRAKEVAPLQHEVARLTALNREYAQHKSVQTAQYANNASAHPDVSDLQAQLVQACEDRDANKVRFERAEQAFHGMAQLLQEARIQMNTQRIRLSEYAYEKEDFPARGAQADGLIQKMKADYHDLEKKANAMFELWKKGQESIKHKQIMHDAAIEDSNFKINNLEALLNRAEEESRSLRDDTEEYFAQVKEGTVPESDLSALRMLYDNSKKTINALKTKIGYQHIQVTNVEGALARERAEVRKLNQKLDKKDSEFSKLDEEKILAERAVEDLESKIELSKGGFEHDMEAKDEQLRYAKEEIEVLKGDLLSIAESGDRSDLGTIIADQRCQITKLENRVQDLWYEKCQREYEQKQFDDHEAQCIGANAYYTKINEVNYEHALTEVERLKKHLELIGQGCDPEKFELAQKYDELEHANELLQQDLEVQKAYYVGQLQDDLVRLTDAKKRCDGVLSRVHMLKDVSEQLCQHLRAAWMGELGTDREITAEMQQAAVDRLQYLDSVEQAIHVVRDGPHTRGLVVTADDEAEALIQDASLEPAGDDQVGDAGDWHSETDPPEDDDDDDSGSDSGTSDSGDLGASNSTGGLSDLKNISDEPLEIAPPQWSDRMDFITKACSRTIPQHDDEPTGSEADESTSAVHSRTESEEYIDDVPGPDAPEDVINGYLDARFKEAQEQRTEVAQESESEAQLPYSAFNAYGPSAELENLQLVLFNGREEPAEDNTDDEVEADLFTPGAASIEARRPYVELQQMAAALGWVAVPLAFVETEHIAVHVDDLARDPDLANAFLNAHVHGNTPAPYDTNRQGATPADDNRYEYFDGDEADRSEDGSNQAESGSVTAPFSIFEDSTADAEDELNDGVLEDEIPGAVDEAAPRQPGIFKDDFEEGSDSLDEWYDDDTPDSEESEGEEVNRYLQPAPLQPSGR